MPDGTKAKTPAIHDAGRPVLRPETGADWLWVLVDAESKELDEGLKEV